MASNAKDCETARLTVEETHNSRKIQPDEKPPATAWMENEEERPAEANSPGENKRLLPSGPDVKTRSPLQAGLTLGVQPSGKSVRLLQTNATKIKPKSVFEKRKELVPLLKPPYFILSVILVIVFVHTCCTKYLRLSLEWIPGTWWKEPWRLLTYGFVHVSVPHLALNSLVALTVGWILEREQGWWRISCLWIGGLVAGALGAGVLQPNVRVVGASAAVYALLTAHIANVCLRHGHIPLWWFRPLSVLVLGTSEMCWALMRPPPSTVGQAAAQAQVSYEHVAWAAHILGAAIGIPLAFIVFTGENHKKPYIVACRIISAALLIAATILVTLHYVMYQDDYREMIIVEILQT